MTAPQTLTLAQFITDRIAEDLATLPAPDGRRSTSRAWWSSDFEVVFIEEDRFAAECESKRRIVELHEHVEGDGQIGCNECGGWDRGYGWTSPGWCDTLRLLALPYADHDDYREEWKP